LSIFLRELSYIIRPEADEIPRAWRMGYLVLWAELCPRCVSLHGWRRPCWTIRRLIGPRCGTMLANIFRRIMSLDIVSGGSTTLLRRKVGFTAYISRSEICVECAHKDPLIPRLTTLGHSVEVWSCPQMRVEMMMRTEPRYISNQWLIIPNFLMWPRLNIKRHSVC
jgi:hypothetical protein